MPCLCLFYLKFGNYLRINFPRPTKVLPNPMSQLGVGGGDTLTWTTPPQLSRSTSGGLHPYGSNLNLSVKMTHPQRLPTNSLNLRPPLSSPSPSAHRPPPPPPPPLSLSSDYYVTIVLVISVSVAFILAGFFPSFLKCCSSSPLSYYYNLCLFLYISNVSLKRMMTRPEESMSGLRGAVDDDKDDGGNQLMPSIKPSRRWRHSLAFTSFSSLRSVLLVACLLCALQVSPRSVAGASSGSMFTLNRCMVSKTLPSSAVKIKYGSLRGLLIRLDRLPASASGHSNETSSSSSSSPTTSHESMTKSFLAHNFRLHASSTSAATHLAPIEAYLGVPYASPPTGALRFMPPVTPSHWRGTRPADRLAPLCPQHVPLEQLIMRNSTEALKRMPLARFEWLRRMIPRASNQSEDCLYLNIYTPVIDFRRLGGGHPKLARTRRSGKLIAAAAVVPLLFLFLTPRPSNVPKKIFLLVKACNKN